VRFDLRGVRRHKKVATRPQRDPGLEFAPNGPEPGFRYHGGLCVKLNVKGLSREPSTAPRWVLQIEGGRYSDDISTLEGQLYEYGRSEAVMEDRGARLALERVRDQIDALELNGAERDPSHSSFAFASRIVCHCRLETASGPPQASGQDMVFDVAGARAACAAGCRAWVRQLELALDRGRSKLFGRGGSWQDDPDRECDGNEQTDRHTSPNLAPGSSVWRHSAQSMSPGHWPFVEAAPTDGLTIQPDFARGGAAVPSQRVWTVKPPFT